MDNLYLIISFLLFLVMMLWILFNMCMNWTDKKVLEEKRNSEFVDCYNMEWLLRDENGLEFCQYFNDVSFEDISYLVGQNVHNIVYMEMRAKYV